MEIFALSLTFITLLTIAGVYVIARWVAGIDSDEEPVH